jgi:hypothetical protein
MASADTARSSGASGIAFDAETAARLRQIANADATSFFIGAFLSSRICRDAAISDFYKKFGGLLTASAALPVTAVPVTVVPAVAVPAPVAAMPTPVATMMPTPVMPVPVMSPADLFGFQMLNFGL